MRMKRGSYVESLSDPAVLRDGEFGYAACGLTATPPATIMIGLWIMLPEMQYVGGRRAA